MVVLAAVELLREGTELTVTWLGLGSGSVARVRVGVRLRVRVRARLRLRIWLRLGWRAGTVVVRSHTPQPQGSQSLSQ